MSFERVLVRRWASGAVHILHPDSLDVERSWTSGGLLGSGVFTIAAPVVSVCGATLRAGPKKGDTLRLGDLIIVMDPDTKKVCRACARFAVIVGVDTASTDVVG